MFTHGGPDEVNVLCNGKGVGVTDARKGCRALFDAFLAAGKSPGKAFQIARAGLALFGTSTDVGLKLLQSEKDSIVGMVINI